MQFRDDYPTCEETFVSLIIASKTIHWGQITSILDLVPSRINDMVKDVVPDSPFVWIYSTRETVQSRDTRRHFAYLLKQLEDREGALSDLRSHGCRTEVSCFWSSATGNGGPILPSVQASQLAAFGLDLLFEFYDASEDCEQDLLTPET